MALNSEGFEALKSQRTWICEGGNLEVKFRGVWNFNNSSLGEGGTDKKWNDPTSSCVSKRVMSDIRLRSKGPVEDY